jgi:hypothetical protein
MGGLNTMRGMARSMLQCSTFTITQTSIRAWSGILKAGLSTMAE